ncbi:MAG: glycine zipper 2TM domain-containing protein [Burkholderiaceae bacterium]
MKTKIALTAISLAAACSTALAAQYGNVISSTPVTAQFAVPQQQCSDQQVLVQPPTSGAGSVLGALVGGVVGNSLGSGAGRAAATGLGVVAGAVIGDRAEAANTPPAEVPLRTCLTVTSYQTRVIGYDVVYEYNGQRFSTRMAQDPGAQIALNVTVAPLGGTLAAAPAQALPVPVAVPVVSIAPPVVYAPLPVYGYYGPNAYFDYYGRPVFAVEPRVVYGGYRYRRHGF